MSSEPSSETAGPATASALPENRLFRLPVYCQQSASELADAIRTAGDAGFSDLIVPLTLDGLPIFPNRADRDYKLPKLPKQFRKRDVLGEIVHVAGECELGLFGVAPFWRPGVNLSADAVKNWLRKHRQWFASEKVAGDLVFCPSNAERRRGLGDLLAECLDGYPLRGIIFDTENPPFDIGPENAWCQCEACREAASEQAGLNIAELAAGHPSPQLLEKWEQWQSDVAFELLAYSAEPGFVDNLTAPGVYEYAVSATDYGENESDQSAGTTYTLLSIVDGMGIPDEFALKANYPNPFNPSTTIGYQLPEAGRVSLVIYDLTGNVVSTLVNESQPAGYYQTVWNGRDQRGVPVATGVYFYRLKAGAEFVKTHKMVLMK